MKKSCKLLLLGTALAATMTVSAAAADFTHCADALHEMDLFSGTEIGYELDRAPTRAEAAVMLVRLLGGEKDATANTYETPFTDVPQWAAPYVGWLYENGLTAGATATTYDTNGLCTAQMYSAFLMRSLGYTDSGANADFSYSTAIDFAKEKGVVDEVNCDTDNFLRDHVVAMSYTALATQPKDGKNDTLLDQLVSTGAVDAQKALPTQDLFGAYHDYMALAEEMNAETDMAMKLKMDMAVALAEMNLMNASMDMDVKANVNLDTLDQTKMSMKGTMTIEMNEALVEEGQDAKQTMDMEAYYTDGYYYVKTGDQKLKAAMSMDQALESMNLSEMQGSEPIVMIKSIFKNADGAFVIEYESATMNSMIANLLTSTGVTTDTAAFTFNKLAATVTPKNGSIDSMTLEVACSVTAEGQNMDISVKADYDITATGDSVKVSLPSDLDTYTDMAIQ